MRDFNDDEQRKEVCEQICGLICDVPPDISNARGMIHLSSRFIYKQLDEIAEKILTCERNTPGYGELLKKYLLKHTPEILIPVYRARLRKKGIEI